MAEGLPEGLPSNRPQMLKLIEIIEHASLGPKRSSPHMKIVFTVCDKKEDKQILEC